jgi:uncharacterized membrane protein
MMIKSVPMSDSVDAPPPDLFAYAVAHLLIGFVVGFLVKAVFRQSTKVAIVAGLIAVALHYNFDAPLGRRLGALRSALRESTGPLTDDTAEMAS